MANYTSAASLASSEPSNLLQNRLFLQYLSGAGAAMQRGEPISAGIDPITQQTIGAQSKHELQTHYMKMLQQMLGGMPQGGKLSGDKDNLTIKIPTSSLSQRDDFDPLSRTQAGGGTPYGGEVDWSKPENQGQLSAFLREGSLDPTASPSDIEAADLAGLTASDVSQALSGAVSVQALKQRGLEAGVAASQRERQMTDVERRTRDIERRTEIYGRPAIPKDERTSAIKNYEYAQSLKGGSTKKTFEEWEKDARTTHQRDYDRAYAEDNTIGTFHEWLSRMTALGGGLSLEEKVTEKEAFADIKARKYFTDPKGLTTDVDRHINTEEVQNRLFAMEPEERERETIREKEKFIVGRITAAGGTIDWTKSRVEGRTFIFSVKWPDGSVKEVRYAN